MKERKLCIFCLSFLIITFMGIQFYRMYFPQKFYVSNLEERIMSGSYVSAAGQIYRKEKASDYQILYLKNVSIAYQNQSIKESRLIIYNNEENQTVKIGNRVTVTGSLEFFEPASNPGSLDQRFYYRKQGVHGYIWTDIAEVSPQTESVLKNSLYELRMRWSTYLMETAGEKYGGILSAMLLGEKSAMDAEMKELYQVNGISHILAISGLHLSIIGHGFYQLIRRGSGSYLAGGITGLVFMTLYIMMIGVSVSALRAVVMFVLRVIADMSGRIYDGLTALSLAAVLVVLWRPLSFYDGGFQLSFGAITSVLFLNPVFKRKETSKNFLYNSITANLSIQIITLPILLYHSYEFPLYSVFLNMIVVPLMSVVLLLAVLSVLFGGGMGTMGYLLIRADVLILRCYEWLCESVLELPHARIVTGQPSLWGMAIYYVCIATMMWIGYLVKNAKGRNLVLAGIVVLGGFFLYLSCPRPSPDELEITMLDVGQGDCFFVRQDDVTCLIDGGSSSENQIAKYKIEPFLKYKGVDELDYIFVSHGDKDHISGVQELMERQREGIHIKTLVLPDKTVWDEALWELARQGDKFRVNVVVMHGGESIRKTDLRIDCLFPERESRKTIVGNESSLVLSLEYLDFDMLFTGDIENEGEEMLLKVLEKQYDVLKVAHHGSRNSTSEELLDAVKPKNGLVSAGENNSYGHPHKETLRRLEEEGCKMWNTAESGAVTLITDGKKLEIKEYLKEEKRYFGRFGK